MSGFRMGWRTPRLRPGDGASAYDALDRLADRVENGGRIIRGIAGGIVVLFVIGLIWSGQSFIRTTHEHYYLAATSRHFPKSVSDDERLAAGYHACHWLRAQDAATFDRPYGGGTRWGLAVDLFENRSPRPAASPFVAGVAWRQLCRGEAQDRLHVDYGRD